MEGEFTKQVVRWCSDDLQKSLSSGFIQMAMKIDEKLRKEHDDLKKERQAFNNEKALFEKANKEKAEEMQRKEVEVQKALHSAKEVEKTKKQLVAEKNKLTSEWTALEESREKFAMDQEALRKRQKDLTEREETFARFEASKMEALEEKEAEVLKHAEAVKGKDLKLKDQKRELDESKRKFEEKSAAFDKAIHDDKEYIRHQKAELEDREALVKFLEMEVDISKSAVQKRGANRRPTEWISLDEYGNDPELLGNNFQDFDRLRKVSKMMETNNGVIYLRTDYPTEMSIGIKSTTTEAISRITTVKGENDRQCLKDLGDELLKRVRNRFAGSARVPSVQSFRA